jgi:hypothetical protein
VLEAREERRSVFRILHFPRPLASISSCSHSVDVVSLARLEAPALPDRAADSTAACRRPRTRKRCQEPFLGRPLVRSVVSHREKVPDTFSCYSLFLLLAFHRLHPSMNNSRGCSLRMLIDSNVKRVRSGTQLRRVPFSFSFRSHRQGGIASIISSLHNLSFHIRFRRILARSSTIGFIFRSNCNPSYPPSV